MSTDDAIAATEQAIEQRDRFEAFLKTYEAMLRKRIETEPDRYSYGLEGISQFIARMREAIPNNDYGIGDAMKDTCAEIGIKASHKHIRAYLVGQ